MPWFDAAGGRAIGGALRPGSMLPVGESSAVFYALVRCYRWANHRRCFMPWFDVAGGRIIADGRVIRGGRIKFETSFQTIEWMPAEDAK
jgi:hypothetical protein